MPRLQTDVQACRAKIIAFSVVKKVVQVVLAVVTVDVIHHASVNVPNHVSLYARMTVHLDVRTLVVIVVALVPAKIIVVQHVQEDAKVLANTHVKAHAKVIVRKYALQDAVIRVDRIVLLSVQDNARDVVLDVKTIVAVLVRILAVVHLVNNLWI